MSYAIKNSRKLSVGQKFRGFSMSHSECVCEIAGSAMWPSDNGLVFSVNPGLPNLFPWLSSFALRFEEYRFTSLSFTYRSRSHNVLLSSTPSLGNVFVAFDYNALNKGFLSKQEIDNSPCVITGSPGHDLTLRVSRDHLALVNHFVRTTVAPVDRDVRFYDLGILQVVTLGQNSPEDLGSLWVTYDVEFYKPIVNRFVAAYPSPPWLTMYFKNWDDDHVFAVDPTDRSQGHVYGNLPLGYTSDGYIGWTSNQISFYVTSSKFFIEIVYRGASVSAANYHYHIPTINGAVIQTLLLPELTYPSEDNGGLSTAPNQYTIWSASCTCNLNQDGKGRNNFLITMTWTNNDHSQSLPTADRSNDNAYCMVRVLPQGESFI